MKQEIIKLEEVSGSYWKEIINDLMKGFTEKIVSAKCTKGEIPRKFLFKEKPFEESSEIILVSFKEVDFIDSDQVISEIRKSSFRPLDMQRFLMIGKQFPKILKDHSIITFSSVWRQGLDLLVPCLWKESGPIPDLFTAFELWGSPSCFAVAS